MNTIRTRQTVRDWRGAGCSRNPACPSRKRRRAPKSNKSGNDDSAERRRRNVRRLQAARCRDLRFPTPAPRSSRCPKVGSWTGEAVPVRETRRHGAQRRGINTIRTKQTVRDWRGAATRARTPEAARYRPAWRASLILLLGCAAAAWGQDRGDPSPLHSDAITQRFYLVSTHIHQVYEGLRQRDATRIEEALGRLRRLEPPLTVEERKGVEKIVIAGIRSRTTGRVRITLVEAAGTLLLSGAAADLDRILRQCLSTPAVGRGSNARPSKATPVPRDLKGRIELGRAAGRSLLELDRDRVLERSLEALRACAGRKEVDGAFARLSLSLLLERLKDPVDGGKRERLGIAKKVVDAALRIQRAPFRKLNGRSAPPGFATELNSDVVAICEKLTGKREPQTVEGWGKWLAKNTRGTIPRFDR